MRLWGPKNVSDFLNVKLFYLNQIEGLDPLWIEIKWSKAEL